MAKQKHHTIIGRLTNGLNFSRCLQRFWWMHFIGIVTMYMLIRKVFFLNGKSIKPVYANLPFVT